MRNESVVKVYHPPTIPASVRVNWYRKMCDLLDLGRQWYDTVSSNKVSEKI